MHVHPLLMVSFKDSIKKAFTKFCSFKGRSRRSEFWLYYLFTQLFLIIPLAIYILVSFHTIIEFIRNATKHRPRHGRRHNINLRPFIALGVIVFINIILSLPLLSLSVRRLHDTGKSGFYLFLCLIPFGFFVIFIFLLEDSHPNVNIYGTSPKYVMMETDPLLDYSRENSFVGTPYINQQIDEGLPAPNPSISPYQQYQQIQQNPPNQQYPIQSQQNTQVQQYPQNQQIVIQQNQEIIEQNYQSINNQQNQQIVEQQIPELYNQFYLESGPVDENQEDFDINRGSRAKPVNP